MELITEKNRIIRSSEGEATEGKFTIKASAQAFQILSDRLYSDKVKAIIRELSCNAFDAHVAAGNVKLPFLMQLPCWSHPEFAIRDYGTGLSREAITSVYTTYFESTKSNSNDFIGCLGLGSKTPFSYTDSFLVESFYKGDKFSYTAFINEEGVPSLRFLGEEKTNEQNGLRVSFAVKRDDFNNFSAKAREVFKWFQTRPIVKGGEYFAFEDAPKFQKEGEDWHLMYPQGYNGQSSYVRMGNVVYPISAAHFPEGFPANLKNLLVHGIVFDFDIGDVDIAPSREALVYNKRTVASLKSRIERFAEEISEDLNDEIKSLDCWYDACCHAITKQWFQSALIQQLLVDEIKYKGRKLESSLSSHELPHRLQSYLNQGFKIWSYGSFSKYMHNAPFNKNFRIFEVDEKISEKNLKETMLLSYNRHNEDVWLVDFKKIPASLIIKLVETLDIDEKYISEISSLPKPEIVPKVPGEKKIRSTVGGGKKKSEVWTLGSSTESKARSFWSQKTSTIDLEDETAERYYLLIDNFKPKHPDHKLGLNGYCSARDYIGGQIEVYGLTERQFEIASKNKTWINFDQKIEAFVRDFCKTNTIFKLYEYTCGMSLSSDLFQIINKSKNKTLKKLAAEVQEITKEENRIISQLWYDVSSSLHGLLDPKDPILAMSQTARYEGERDKFKKLTKGLPKSPVLEFIAECKKHPVLFNYCHNLRWMSGDNLFTIDHAAAMIDLAS